MRAFAILVVGGFAAVTAFAVPTVSLSLSSQLNEHTVAPGTSVYWTISVSVSPIDNLGLALVCVDLIQDPGDPALFSLPPGSEASIDATMQHFNRPDGICNPPEGGAATGYIGVQRGNPGAENLVQIGGALNTFGAAVGELGTSTTVVSGVGQGGPLHPQIVLSGSFTAPATLGTYQIQLANGLATVLSGIGAPPAFSPVIAATVTLAQPTLTFTVAESRKGDMNCDGFVNNGDIDAFILALTNSVQYAAEYPSCDITNADINGDGFANNGDIDAFIALITGG